MINPTEVINVLHINGVTNTSSVEDVRATLKALGYKDLDIESILGLLKGQGWFPNEKITPIDVSKMASSIDMSVPPPQAPVSNLSSPIMTETVYVPTEPKVKRNWGGIIFLIILLLLIGGGAWYVYTNNIDLATLMQEWYQALLMRLAV